jgi:hypothetical protein
MATVPVAAISRGRRGVEEAKCKVTSVVKEVTCTSVGRNKVDQASASKKAPSFVEQMRIDTTWVRRVVALDITYHCAHKVKSVIHN